jgi:hypothetical protein
MAARSRCFLATIPENPRVQNLSRESVAKILVDGLSSPLVCPYNQQVYPARTLDAYCVVREEGKDSSDDTVLVVESSSSGADSAAAGLVWPTPSTLANYVHLKEPTYPVQICPGDSANRAYHFHCALRLDKKVSLGRVLAVASYLRARYPAAHAHGLLISPESLPP